MTTALDRRVTAMLLSSVSWIAAVVLSGCSATTPPIASEPGDEHEPKLCLPSKVHEVSQKVDACLSSVYAHNLPARCPNWIAFHALLMYGDSAYHAFARGHANNNLNRAFSIILNSENRPDGLFEFRRGVPYTRRQGSRFSLEHHPCQFLSYFSMAGGQTDALLMIDGESHSVDKLLKGSMREANVEIELAYVVLAYSYYFERGQVWTNKFGEQMSLAILLEELLRKPERTCMGTHRLGALARTLSRPELRHDPHVRKLWPTLESQVASALRDLQQRQRNDGTFLPPGRAACSPSREHQDIYYSGHSLEWVTFLGNARTREEWVVRALEALVDAVNGTYEQTLRNMDVDGSDTAHYDFDALAHAVSGLRRWRDLISIEPTTQR